MSHFFIVKYTPGAVGSRVLDNKIIHVINDPLYQIRFSRHVKDVDGHWMFWGRVNGFRWMLNESFCVWWFVCSRWVRPRRAPGPETAAAPRCLTSKRTTSTGTLLHSDRVESKQYRLSLPSGCGCCQQMSLSVSSAVFQTNRSHQTRQRQPWHQRWAVTCQSSTGCCWSSTPCSRAPRHSPPQVHTRPSASLLLSVLSRRSYTVMCLQRRQLHLYRPAASPTTRTAAAQTSWWARRLRRNPRGTGRVGRTRPDLPWRVCWTSWRARCRLPGTTSPHILSPVEGQIFVENRLWWK